MRAQDLTRIIALRFSKSATREDETSILQMENTLAMCGDLIRVATQFVVWLVARC